eukprot:TRINITY_DN70268_c0_g1_i1.p1 TRINITY_DN70268_c0_g1~~TRINITY_DN70268_c0_g1_i1.p1  ORF type:complete len:440 (+),score=110.39 TRINITY_DN70268_c0_g1_i1:85-1320(+)
MTVARLVLLCCAAVGASAMRRHPRLVLPPADLQLPPAPAGDERRPPVFPMNWITGMHSPLYPPFLGSPKVCQEGTKRRTAYIVNGRMSFAPLQFVGTPQEWENVTQYMLDSFNGVLINGEAILADPTPWADMFGWVPHSHYQGTVTRGGKQLPHWALETPQGTFGLLVTADGTPVELNQTLGNTTLSYTFFDWQPNVTDPEVWRHFNRSAYLHPDPCPEPKDMSPVNTTMYIFHPKNNFNITGQDLGDAVGDVFFTCEDFLEQSPGSIDHGYAWITKWEIEHLPRWGQYQNCNGYPPDCLGANNWWVGHEAANALAPVAGGQCAANPLVGEWWSLPAGGACADGNRPGDGSCTWRKSRRLKTIDSTCLLATGYKHACLTDKRCPFPSATKKFLGAFASSDPAQGGCPDLVH